MLAVTRGSSWEATLFVHVAGALLLVGGLFVASACLIYAWRRADETKVQTFAYKTLFFVALPAYIVMRVGAQLVLSKSPYDLGDNDPTWVGIGFIISDASFLVLIITLILAGIGFRRTRDGGGLTGARVITVLSVALLIAYVVAIWAMTTKPT